MSELHSNTAGVHNPESPSTRVAIEGGLVADIAEAQAQVDAQPEARASRSAELDALVTQLEPLFAGTGGIDSWIGNDTPPEVVDRLTSIRGEPLSRAQLSQLLIMSHEAGPSEGFFKYYWLSIPLHTYDVATHGTNGYDISLVTTWTQGSRIVSLDHLRWGLYRFYVDSLLYFGNIRSAYRYLRDRTFDQIQQFFAAKRFDADALVARGPSLPLVSIPQDDRYLVAEYACKSFASVGGTSRFGEMLSGAYKAHVEQGGSPVVSVDELIQGQFVRESFKGAQQQFNLSADDIIHDVVADEEELAAKVAALEKKFNGARSAALTNTRLYLSMVEDLDVYVATSMRTRDHFRRMASFCQEIFCHSDVADLTLRYFDPTLSAAEGHIDKGLIECLMVDAAKALVYFAGDRETLGKDFEAAMALSRGKPVIFFCDDAEKERMYRDVHPLTRLIEFDTGVAIGAVVATSVDTVRELLNRLFRNKMVYRLVKTDTGALHLNEDLTGCLVRLQTHDRLLQETFWNYYHRRGIMA